jgi:hypothetical protein
MNGFGSILSKLKRETFEHARVRFDQLRNLRGLSFALNS